MDKNFESHANEFSSHFGVELRDYLNSGGFDIIKFKRWVVVPDGISLTDELRDRWGMEADALIDKLIWVTPYSLEEQLRNCGQPAMID